MDSNLEVFSQPNVRPAVISLIGRPNVGKSTLFNRVSGLRQSIVHAEPGATRDRLYADVALDGVSCIFVDTGGIDTLSEAPMRKAILKQTERAIEEADVIVFVVDAFSGLLPTDQEIAQSLRHTKKNIIVAVNKAESTKVQQSATDFYRLGFEHLVLISAAHGEGLATLFETIVQVLPDEFKGGNKVRAQDLLHTPRINDIPVAIVGRPNVGKSSFVNKVLGEERHLTSDDAGTTMDAVDSIVEYQGQRFRLIDTAGIRKKRSIFREIEKMAVSASLGAMDRALVVVLVVDATEGLTEQDIKIAAFANDKGKGIVIVVNKWDLKKKEKASAEDFAQKMRDQMPFLAFAPIRFASALTGSRVLDVLTLAAEVAARCLKRISTSEVNRLLENILTVHQPSVVKGRRVKIYYGTQVGVAPPTFMMVTNEPKGIHFSYQRFLLNRIREEFGFQGVPLRLIFRGRDSKNGRN